LTLDFRKDADAPDLLAETTEVSSSREHSEGVPGQGLAEQMAAVSPGGGIVQQLEAVRPGAIREPGAVQKVAAAGVQGGGSQLPHASEIQAAFGHHDVGSIDSHVGGAAGAANRAMGAEAYATGNQVAFESAPDLHTAAHEAAHVVQQRAGNSPSGGVSTPGDSLEHNADAAADAVTSGRSAEGLLDSVASPGATGGGDAVQCKEAGSSSDIHYEEVQEGETEDMTYQEGSAMVVGSAGDTQQAYDASFTPRLIQFMEYYPESSLDELLEYISGKKFDVHSKTGHAEHHATIAEYGAPMAGRSEGQEPTRRAQLITNQNYKAISKLQTPHEEGAALGGMLAGRGFSMIAHSKDKSAAAMTARYLGRLVDPAQPGDELVAYFAGHGEPRGMCGIDDLVNEQDDVMTNSEIASITQAAVDKGAHMRFIMDACHSGAAAGFVRNEQMNELAQNDAVFQSGVCGASAIRIHAYKCALVDHSRERESTLADLECQLEAHMENKPTSGAVAQATHAWQEHKLRDTIAHAKQRHDRQIDELWARFHTALMAICDALCRAQQCPVLHPPKTITNYVQLGAQIDYLDSLMNVAIATPAPRASSGAV